MAHLQLLREPDWEARGLRMYGELAGWAMGGAADAGLSGQLAGAETESAASPVAPLSEGRVLQIGLTGGIGSGKSQVAALLAQVGAKVCSADDFARRALEEQTPRIAHEFGHPEWEHTGVDRAQLAAIVFADPTARARLEALTHPRIAHLADTFFTSLRPGEVGVYEIPLLAESERDLLFDAVITVSAPLETRLRRLVELRGFTPEQARARIDAQASDEQRRALAHWELHNDSTVTDLQRVVFGELWPQLLAAAAGK